MTPDPALWAVPETVLAYLQANAPAVNPSGPPTRLRGGHLNYVWRVPAQPASVVVKAVPPYIADAPEIELDAGRAAFEVRSLEALGPGGTLAGLGDDGCRAPHLIHFDAAGPVLVIEDVGEGPDLGGWLHRPKASAPSALIGERLGTFIGGVHAQTYGDIRLAIAFDNQSVQATRHRVQYQAVEGLCERAGMSEAAAAGAAAVALGEQLQTPGQCVVMGDLWPPSVLVVERGLRVIDWEMAHFGRPAQDVAHLAAHLWMQAHRALTPEGAARARTLWQAFVESYVAALNSRAPALLGHQMRDASARHFGAEVLVRTVGAFQEGYVYDGLQPDAALVQEALAIAVEHLLNPHGVDTFKAFTV